MSGIGDWLASPELQGMAALAAVATVAAGGLRWLGRRRHPLEEAMEPAQFAGRARKAFLERVWSQRIVNGLDRSLQHAAEMHLGLANTPELMKLSFSQSTAAPGEVLGIEAVYEQSGSELLIVGPPGSGKTTEALKLMRHLLEVARQDPSAPVPEIFPPPPGPGSASRFSTGWPTSSSSAMDGLLGRDACSFGLTAWCLSSMGWTRSRPSTGQGAFRPSTASGRAIAAGRWWSAPGLLSTRSFPSG